MYLLVYCETLRHSTNMPVCSDRVVACYFMSREFAAFRLIFYNRNTNDMLSVASNVSIASDDDQIQAHK